MNDILLEDILLKYLNFNNGFYIEAGAYDGIFFSNTLKLERERGWNGLLIEPSINVFNCCKRNRSNDKNIFINCALIGNENVKTVRGDFNCGPASSINGLKRNRTSNVIVNARTLNSILMEYDIKKIDFFSLDVEGFEYEVLLGLDLKKYRPKYICIEINNNDGRIFETMKNNEYILIDNLTKFTKQTHPKWDGTHNDFLFEDKGVLV